MRWNSSPLSALLVRTTGRPSRTTLIGGTHVLPPSVGPNFMNLLALHTDLLAVVRTKELATQSDHMEQSVRWSEYWVL